MPNSERPNKVVMGLGIATVVLLSANLIAVLAQRVWPKLQDLALVKSATQTEEIAPEAETSTIHLRMMPNRHGIVRVSPLIHSRHRCGKKHFETIIRSRSDVDVDTDFDFDFDFDFDRDTEFDFDLDTQLDLDLDQLEREIERETSKLENELSFAGEELGEAIALRLRLHGNQALVLNRNVDLSELEEKIQGITREFEIQVRKHEKAAKKARVIVRERDN